MESIVLNRRLQLSPTDRDPVLDATWRAGADPLALAVYLDRMEAAAYSAIISRDRNLAITAEGLRRRGPNWFDGVPFSLLPGIHNRSISSAVCEVIAKAVQRSTSTQNFAMCLKDDWELLHDATSRDTVLRLLFALGCEHGDAAEYTSILLSSKDGAVRALSIGLLTLQCEQGWARRRLYRLTHDIDDRVFLAAFRAISSLRLPDALPDLLHIVLRPSILAAEAESGRSANPVGLGGSLCLLAILGIAGSDDPAHLAKMERQFPPSMALYGEQFESLNRARNSSPVAAATIPAADQLEIPFITIPSGQGVVGTDRNSLPSPIYPGTFRQTNIPRRTVSIQGYRIARDPITNAVYDQFVSDFKKRGGREFEHPLQPENKDHTRTTFGDLRFGSDHPVAGVDWFDAYAFCRFYGLRLPTEDEWEWAAAGPAYQAPARMQTFDGGYGQFTTIKHWYRSLAETSDIFPPVTTASVNDDCITGFGLRHAIGNVWEYTNSNFFTRDSFGTELPDVRFTPEQYMSLHYYHVVIKGGAWTSAANMLAPSYRGLDLYSDRHCEIGFRAAAV